jgi:hypothetical protein
MHLDLHQTVKHSRHWWVELCADEADDHIEEDISIPTAEGGGHTHDSNLEALRATLEALKECNTVEKADELAISFCFIQTKGTCCQGLLLQ